MNRCIVAMVMAFSFSAIQAADVVGQRYIDQLTRGGSVSIKQAAESMYNTGERNTEVLDVAAEVLLDRYPTSSSRDIDTLAWLCRALGNSRNSRYYSTLNEVAQSNSHRKLRKYAKKAMKEVGNSGSEQYVKGSIDIAAMRQSGQEAEPQKVAEAQPENSSGKQGLDVLREGMSMQEVIDLVGHPTATSTHQTGKAWIPFNFGGKDLARTYLLYKGKGRVVCSHDAYTSTTRVLEVIIDSE